MYQEERDKLVDECEVTPERNQRLMEALETGELKCCNCKHWREFCDEPDLGDCRVIERGRFDSQFFCWYWQFDQGGEQDGVAK